MICRAWNHSKITRIYSIVNKMFKLSYTIFVKYPVHLTVKLITWRAGIIANIY